MLNATEKADLEKGYRVLWVIWAAMIGSLAVYVFVCRQLGGEIRRTGNADFIQTLKQALFLVSALTLVSTYFLRKLMLSGRFGSAAKVRDGSGRPVFLARYTVVTIVALALSESVGIYGLVLFLLGDTLQTLYAFIGLSAVAMLVYRPKREELEALARGG